MRNSNAMSDTLSGGNNSLNKIKTGVNYGERLYQRGIKRKEEVDRQMREIKSEYERLDQE